MSGMLEVGCRGDVEGIWGSKVKADCGSHVIWRDEGFRLRPWAGPREGCPHAVALLCVTEGGMCNKGREAQKNGSKATRNAIRMVAGVVPDNFFQYHMWASGDRSSVHGGRSGRTAAARLARLVFEATAQTIPPAKCKRSLRLRGARQRPHPRYRRPLDSLPTARERRGNSRRFICQCGIARVEKAAWKS